MPEFVQTWIDTHDYRLVEEVQGRILKDYADDFAKHANAEVDFISDYQGYLFPIEAKSADNTKAKSLHLFCTRFAPKFAFKTSLKNVG